jgi:hypothetical protein
MNKDSKNIQLSIRNPIASMNLLLEENFEKLVLILLTLTIVIMALTNLAGLANPILEAHGFRQTQTAITAYYLKLSGFKLDYETPTVGYPWSIPFEFPIYQYIAAQTSKIFNLALTDSGRLISLIFTFLCALPIWKSLKKLEFSDTTGLICLTLFFSSPVYLFWSGTFMIESTALFFTLFFVYFIINILKGSRSGLSLFGAATFLLLASLQKVTTVLAPLVIFALIYLSQMGIKNILADLKWTLKLALAILIALAIAFMWIKYSDQVKSLNPIGAKLTSSHLSQWNYGTLSQRLSFHLWHDVIYYRNIVKMSGQFIGLLILLYYLKSSQNVRNKKLVLVALSLFFVPFLVFTNLHIVHSYYQVANSLFFSMGLGIAIAGLIFESSYRAKMYVKVFFIAIVTSNLYFYMKGSYNDKVIGINPKEHKVLVIAEYIKDTTPPDRPVIWYGLDWSSEGPFYSERKSLAVPAWIEQTEPVLQWERYLNSPPSAIVLCEPLNRAAIVNALETYILTHRLINRASIAGCEIFNFT